jgi:adenylylsulfate kinase
MHRKILIMGLPGAGKTTLARCLAPLLNAVVFNADEVRAHINRDLGFSHEDRIEHARRMGWMSDRVVEAGGTAIADFICPTPQTRTAFGPAFTVWVDRIEEGRFADTNRLFVPPQNCDIRVTADGGPRHWAERILARLRPTFDPQRPTALFIGRYQPFHDGHRHLVEEGIRRVGQACLAVRNTHGTDSRNPLSFFEVKQRIEAGLAAHAGRYIVVPLPNVTHVLYGRDVGYVVERIELVPGLEAISATELRQQIGYDAGDDSANGDLRKHQAR